MRYNDVKIKDRMNSCNAPHFTPSPIGEGRGEVKGRGDGGFLPHLHAKAITTFVVFLHNATTYQVRNVSTIVNGAKHHIPA